MVVAVGNCRALLCRYRMYFFNILVMFKVSVLNQREFEEESVPPDPLLTGAGYGWNGFGMHHISAERLADGTWIAAVDGNRE